MNKNDGIKLDDKKNRYDLLPYDALDEVVKVYTYGAKKYEVNNWRKGFRFGRIFAAMMRHLVAYWRGEDKDKESGLLHLAHAVWGCLTLINFSKTHPENDDRIKEN